MRSSCLRSSMVVDISDNIDGCSCAVSFSCLGFFGVVASHPFHMFHDVVAAVAAVHGVANPWFDDAEGVAVALERDDEAFESFFMVDVAPARRI